MPGLKALIFALFCFSCVFAQSTVEVNTISPASSTKVFIDRIDADSAAFKGEVRTERVKFGSYDSLSFVTPKIQIDGAQARFNASTLSFNSATSDISLTTQQTSLFSTTTALLQSKSGNVQIDAPRGTTTLKSTTTTVTSATGFEFKAGPGGIDVDSETINFSAKTTLSLTGGGKGSIRGTNNVQILSKAGAINVVGVGAASSVDVDGKEQLIVDARDTLSITASGAGAQFSIEAGEDIDVDSGNSITTTTGLLGFSVTSTHGPITMDSAGLASITAANNLNMNGGNEGIFISTQGGVGSEIAMTAAKSIQFIAKGNGGVGGKVRISSKNQIDMTSKSNIDFFSNTMSFEATAGGLAFQTGPGNDLKLKSNSLSFKLASMSVTAGLKGANLVAATGDITMLTNAFTFKSTQAQTITAGQNAQITGGDVTITSTSAVAGTVGINLQATNTITMQSSILGGGDTSITGKEFSTAATKNMKLEGQDITFTAGALTMQLESASDSSFSAIRQSDDTCYFTSQTATLDANQQLTLSADDLRLSFDTLTVGDQPGAISYTSNDGDIYVESGTTSTVSGTTVLVKGNLRGEVSSVGDFVQTAITNDVKYTTLSMSLSAQGNFGITGTKATGITSDDTINISTHEQEDHSDAITLTAATTATFTTQNTGNYRMSADGAFTLTTSSNDTTQAIKIISQSGAKTVRFATTDNGDITIASTTDNFKSTSAAGASSILASNVAITATTQFDIDSNNAFAINAGNRGLTATSAKQVDVKAQTSMAISSDGAPISFSFTGATSVTSDTLDVDFNSPNAINLHSQSGAISFTSTTKQVAITSAGKANVNVGAHANDTLKFTTKTTFDLQSAATFTTELNVAGSQSLGGKNVKLQSTNGDVNGNFSTLVVLTKAYDSQATGAATIVGGDITLLSATAQTFEIKGNTDIVFHSKEGSLHHTYAEEDFGQQQMGTFTNAGQTLIMEAAASQTQTHTAVNLELLALNPDKLLDTKNDGDFNALFDDGIQFTTTESDDIYVDSAGDMIVQALGNAANNMKFTSSGSTVYDAGSVSFGAQTTQSFTAGQAGDINVDAGRDTRLRSVGTTNIHTTRTVATGGGDIEIIAQKLLQLHSKQETTFTASGSTRARHSFSGNSNVDGFDSSNFELGISMRTTDTSGNIAIESTVNKILIAPTKTSTIASPQIVELAGNAFQLTSTKDTFIDSELGSTQLASAGDFTLTSTDKVTMEASRIMDVVSTGKISVIATAATVGFLSDSGNIHFETESLKDITLTGVTNDQPTTIAAHDAIFDAHGAVTLTAGEAATINSLAGTNVLARSGPLSVSGLAGTITAAEDMSLNAGAKLEIFAKTTLTVTATEDNIIKTTAGDIDIKAATDSLIQGTSTVLVRSAAADSSAKVKSRTFVQAKTNLKVTAETEFNVDAGDSITIGSTTKPTVLITVEGDSKTPGFVALSEGDIHFKTPSKYLDTADIINYTSLGNTVLKSAKAITVDNKGTNGATTVTAASELDIDASSTITVSSKQQVAFTAAQGGIQFTTNGADPATSNIQLLAKAAFEAKADVITVTTGNFLAKSTDAGKMDLFATKNIFLTSASDIKAVVDKAVLIQFGDAIDFTTNAAAGNILLEAAPTAGSTMNILPAASSAIFTSEGAILMEGRAASGQDYVIKATSGDISYDAGTSAFSAITEGTQTLSLISSKAMDFTSRSNQLKLTVAAAAQNLVFKAANNFNVTSESDITFVNTAAFDYTFTSTQDTTFDSATTISHTHAAKATFTVTGAIRHDVEETALFQGVELKVKATGSAPIPAEFGLATPANVGMVFDTTEAMAITAAVNANLIFTTGTGFTANVGTEEQRSNLALAAAGTVTIGEAATPVTFTTVATGATSSPSMKFTSQATFNIAANNQDITFQTTSSDSPALPTGEETLSVTAAGTNQHTALTMSYTSSQGNITTIAKQLTVDIDGTYASNAVGPEGHTFSSTGAFLLKGGTGIVIESNNDVNFNSHGDYTSKHNKISFTVEGSNALNTLNEKPGITINHNAPDTDLDITATAGAINVVSANAFLEGSSVNVVSNGASTYTASGSSQDPIIKARSNGLTLQATNGALTLACTATNCNSEFVAAEEIDISGNNFLINSAQATTVNTIFEATREIKIDTLVQIASTSAYIEGGDGVTFDLSGVNLDTTYQGANMLLSAGTLKQDGDVHFSGEDITIDGQDTFILSGDNILGESQNQLISAQQKLNFIGEQGGVAFLALGTGGTTTSDLTIKSEGSMTLNAFRNVVHQDHAKLSFFGVALAAQQDIKLLADVVNPDCTCTAGDCSCPVHLDQLENLAASFIAYGIFV